MQVRVYATRCEREDNVLYEMDKLTAQLMRVRVCGIENVSRAIIVAKADNEKTDAEKRSGRACYKLLIEGTALQVGHSPIAERQSNGTDEIVCSSHDVLFSLHAPIRMGTGGDGCERSERDRGEIDSCHGG